MRDPYPNALATPEPLLGHADGTVAFGLNLLRSELSASPAWGAAVAGIMAHEWGHIRQFGEGLARPGPHMELHADFLAGWYMGVKAALGTWVVVENLARSPFSKGDYEFNNPNHHGTPDQRVAAMAAGFRLGYNDGEDDIYTAFERGRQEIGL